MEGLFVVTVDRDGLPVEVEDGRPALAARVSLGFTADFNNACTATPLLLLGGRSAASRDAQPCSHPLQPTHPSPRSP